MTVQDVPENSRPTPSTRPYSNPLSSRTSGPKRENDIPSSPIDNPPRDPYGLSPSDDLNMFTSTIYPELPPMCDRLWTTLEYLDLSSKTIPIFKKFQTIPQDKKIPPHRSHSPTTNLKRSDPFQFGSRYLLPTDDPFEYNAWDHVAPSPSDLAHTESQLSLQRSNPVSDYDRSRFNADPEKWWNRFYTNNTSNFFKDRKWLKQEFPILKDLTEKGVGKKVVLEVGAGAGNTALPIMRGNENEELVLHACDFSKKAVELIKGSEVYAEQGCGRLEASVWDVAGESLPEGVEENSVDVVLLIFIFSALSPKQWDQAVRNLWRVLKEGGEVCFRDYGRGDLAQVRFRKGRWMEENFYVRGDGTRVYFFAEEELREMWSGGRSSQESDVKESRDGAEDGAKTQSEGDSDRGKAIEEDNGERASADPIAKDSFSRRFPRLSRMTHSAVAPSLDDDAASQPEGMNKPAFEVATLGVDRRMIVNRQRRIKMYRCWMQGRFRKVVDPSTASQPPKESED